MNSSDAQRVRAALKEYDSLVAEEERLAAAMKAIQVYCRSEGGITAPAITIDGLATFQTPGLLVNDILAPIFAKLTQQLGAVRTKIQDLKP